MDYFQSAEITGDGSEQSNAHGLGRTPVVVIVTVTEDTGTAGSLDILEGTHTSTNILVTAPATIKYKIVTF